jgi:hypothetical protein
MRLPGNMSGSRCPDSKAYRDACFSSVWTLIDSRSLLKSHFCRCADLLGTGVDPVCPASPTSFHDAEGTFNWCNWPKQRTSRAHGPATTVAHSPRDQPWADHGSSFWKAHANGRSRTLHVSVFRKVGVSRGALGHRELHTALQYPLSPCWSSWPASQRAATDCGIPPTASASSKHRSADDLLPVC